MRILVACEESQAITKELRSIGHECYSCDLQECSGGHDEWHLNVDARQLLKMKWDLIIAHPPCTYMTNGGAVRMYKEKGVIDEDRYKKAMEAKEFFMAFYNAKCPHIAIENPVPMTCIGLPPYDQVIQPYEYGDPYSKKTCLWLKGLPKLKPTNILDEYQPFINGGGGRLERQNYNGKTFANGSKARSKTFPGIAKAMALQWVVAVCNGYEDTDDEVQSVGRSYDFDEPTLFDFSEM